MKIAYCLSGQPRGIKTASEYVKRNLLDKFDVDVFGHSWYGANDSLIKEFYPQATMTFDHPMDIKWSNVNRNFRQKGHNEDNLMSVHYANEIADRWPPISTISGFYSKFRAMQLMKMNEIQNGQYDFVIVTRYDYALNLEIPFQRLRENDGYNPEGKGIYIPDCRMTPARDFGNDQFAVGSSCVMTDYCSTYLYLNQFYNEGVQMIGEDMMSANLKRCGLVGNRLFYIDMNNPFPPGPYNGTPHSLVREDMEQWLPK